MYSLKKYTLFFSLLLLLACNENKPIIPCLSCEDDLTPGGEAVEQKALIEEFTGVRCVNCPQAKKEIKNLQSESVFGKKFIAVSYHAGFFSAPYPTNKSDYRTPQGNEIIEFLGQPIGFPSGVINRKKFSGEGDLQIEQFATWSGFVTQELKKTAVLGIKMETSFSASGRVLNVSVEILPTQNIREKLNLTLLVTEDKIVDVQLTPTGFDTNFEQADMFRGMITNTFGNSLPSPLTAQKAVSQVFSFKLPTEWKAENCKVVGFVHQAELGKEVLQVEEVRVVN